MPEIALPEPTRHPRRLKLTPEAVAELDWFVARSWQTLSDILITFQRMESGLELIYGLDFEIIYAYANPWSRLASQARLVQYLIEKDKTPFVLLPGTVEELKIFIDFANRKKVEIERVLGDLHTSKATKKTLLVARKLCATAGIGSLGEDDASREVNFDQLAHAAIQAADRYVLALKRIDFLLKMDRRRELQAVFPDDADRLWHEPDVITFADRLYHFRSDREKNLPDARNLAVIASHGNEQAKWFARDKDNYLRKGTMLRLLTNTRCLFNMNIEKEYSDHFLQKLVKTDLATRNDVSHSFAVRNCAEAALAAAIQQQFDTDNISKYRNQAFQYRHSILCLKGILTQIDNEARNYSFQGDYDTERMAQVLDELSRLVGGQSAAELLKDPWYTTVKYLLLDYESEFENKRSLSALPEKLENVIGINALPDKFETIDVIDLCTSLDIQLPIRNSSLGKIEVIMDKDIQSLLDSYRMDCVRHEINIGGDALQTFIVTSTESLGGVHAVRIDLFEGIWYAGWRTSMSMDEAITLVKSIFVKNSISLGRYQYAGSLYLNVCNAIEDYEPTLEKICALPLQTQLHMAEYSDLVHLLSEIRNVSDLEPIDIRCDTTVCHLRIDIAPLDGRPGILFAFQDSALLPVLIEIFKRTSPFGRCLSCIDEMEKIVTGEAIYA